jgi:hypothetical protein
MFFRMYTNIQATTSLTTKERSQFIKQIIVFMLLYLLPFFFI